MKIFELDIGLVLFLVFVSNILECPSFNDSSIISDTRDIINYTA